MFIKINSNKSLCRNSSVIRVENSCVEFLDSSRKKHKAKATHDGLRDILLSLDIGCQYMDIYLDNNGDIIEASFVDCDEIQAA
jgi:hypothetical protein